MHFPNLHLSLLGAVPRGESPPLGSNARPSAAPSAVTGAQLADKEFGGNLSALVTDLAEEARRRLAAGAYLSRHRIPSLTPDQAAELEGEIAREVAGAKHRGRGGKAA